MGAEPRGGAGDRAGGGGWPAAGQLYNCELGCAQSLHSAQKSGTMVMIFGYWDIRGVSAGAPGWVDGGSWREILRPGDRVYQSPLQGFCSSALPRSLSSWGVFLTPRARACV